MPDSNKLTNKFLGDPHNGGKAVCLNNKGRIEKPRPCLAEWFFLSDKSPLRILYNDTFIFTYFPNLEFYGEELSCHGEVSRLDVDPNLIDSSHVHKVAEATGNLLAVSQWFGLSDLHFENIKFGIDRNNKLILAPIDIECFFQEIKLPFQTGLISKNNTDKNFGFKGIISQKNGSPVRIIENYLSTMKMLKSRQSLISKIINEVFTQADLSRVILQDTANYHEWIDGKVLSCLYTNEEIAQLTVGDIPYFFRTLYSKQINYWSKNQITPVAHGKAIHTYLDQIPLNELDIYWKNVDNYLKQSALQIADRVLVDTKTFSETSSHMGIKKVDGYLEISTSDWRCKCAL
jgi:hypothetical protein